MKPTDIIKPIRVMIIEDSPTAKELLLTIVNSDPELEVVAAVESGEKALKIINQVKPDVISLDIRLPGIDGFETTRQIMSKRPTPIVVVSASVNSDDLKISMNAIRAGALSVVEKPVGSTNADYQRVSREICTQLKIMSEVKVIRQWVTGSSESCNLESNLRSQKKLFDKVSKGCEYKIMGIVASTGGPNALHQILGQLPSTFPIPILVVQHIGQNFLSGFVSWLASISKLPVVMITSKEIPKPGCIYLSQPDCHLLAEYGCIRPDDSPLIHQQRPSGTILFNSIAKCYGKGAIGIILTGMGEDGADGLKAIRDAGGYTIAQDQSTSAVYGMPGSAVKLGGVCESLPVHQIPARILKLLERS